MAGGERHIGARDVSDFALVIAVLSSLRAKHKQPQIKIIKCLKHEQNTLSIPPVPQIQAALCELTYVVHACARDTRRCPEPHPYPSCHLCVNCFVTFLHLHIHPQQQTTASVTRALFLTFNPHPLSPSVHMCVCAPPPPLAGTHTFIFYMPTMSKCLSALQAIFLVA